MQEWLKELRFTHVEPTLADVMEQARLHSLTDDAFLKRVLSLEVEGRKRTAQHHRLKSARLPLHKTLEAFDFSFQSTLSERRLWE